MQGVFIEGFVLRFEVQNDFWCRVDLVGFDDADGGAQRLLARVHLPPPPGFRHYPEGNAEAKLKSISHRCHPILEASMWEITKETTNLPLGCLKGGMI